MANFLVRLAVLAAGLSLAMAQQTTPENSNPPSPNMPSYILDAPMTGTNMLPVNYPLAFAWEGLYFGDFNPSALQTLNITGQLVVTTPTNTNSLVKGDIALISCDASFYNGSNLSIDQVVNLAIAKVSPNLNDDTSSQGCILFYSQQDAYCQTLLSVNTDPVLFTMTSIANTNALLEQLTMRNVTMNTTGSITVNMTSFNALASTPSGPTVSAAMIVLYSVVGLITVLFLFIISLGAFKARRHPERYGLRALTGHSRPQHVARGIARAMLDTIPIVKFGDSEDHMNSSAAEQGKASSESVSQESATKRDIEMAEIPAAVPAVKEAKKEAQPENTAVQPVQETTTVPEPPVPANEPQPEPVPVEAPNEDGPAPAITTATAPAADPHKPHCSVCTEDFVKGEDIRVLPCKHMFHPACVDPWLLNVSGTCPLCRIDLHGPNHDSSDPQAFRVAEREFRHGPREMPQDPITMNSAYFGMPVLRLPRRQSQTTSPSAHISPAPPLGRL